MNHEESRLRTFSAWPSDAVIEAARIASGGFFYTGQGMEVQCFSCGGKISEWKAGDHVMARHRRLDPRCPFIVNPATSGNIPKFQNSQNRSVEMDTELLQSELARLETYLNWPISHIVTAENLAKAGFYYLQQGDKVKCVFCNGIVGCWEVGDDPKNEHRRHFPNCTYVQSNFVETRAPSPVNINSNLKLNDCKLDLLDLGIQTHKGPKQANYATIESRLRTYINWPVELIQTPEMLSEAGFYYVGMGDQVRCFHCDGGLRHWDPQDEPWIEHARWFPSCSFLRIVKGNDFVRSCATEQGNIRENQEIRRNRSLPTERTISETDIQQYMNTPEVITALSIGIDIGRVKNALRYKIGLTGSGFLCADTLIECALNLDAEDSEIEDGNSYEIEGILSNVMIQNERPATTGNTNVQETTTKEVSNQGGDNVQQISLEEENRLLKEARICKICMDNEIGVVFLPCGHLNTCINCAPSLKDCPICRSSIRATVRTFLS